MLSVPMIPRLFRLLIAAAVLACAGACRTMDIAVMPPEESSDDFFIPPQNGPSDAWDDAIADSKVSGQAKLGLLDHGDEALAARISLIRSAKKSIHIQTFNWKIDDLL